MFYLIPTGLRRDHLFYSALPCKLQCTSTTLHTSHSQLRSIPSFSLYQTCIQWEISSRQEVELHNGNETVTQFHALSAKPSERAGHGKGEMDYG